MTVVAVGKSGFLAGAVREKTAGKDWLFLSHDEAFADTRWLENAAAIVNFAFSPALRTGEYDSREDVDSRLAALIGDRPVSYIMLSSRAAYGPAPAGSVLREGQDEQPSTPYGRNKLAVERALLKTLGGRLTILRLANIFGHERGRDSFFGRALSGLADRKVIRFDMNPAQRRDFLAAWRFADALLRIADNPAAGLFNLGSGCATACADIANWLIAGYGAGVLEVSDSGKNDQFCLDMTKTREAYGLPVVTAEELRLDCMACGKKLGSG